MTPKEKKARTERVPDVLIRVRVNFSQLQRISDQIVKKLMKKQGYFKIS